MKQIKVQFAPPQPKEGTRAERREKKIIDDYLNKIVLQFLIECQGIGAINFSPNITETDKVHNFRMGILPGDKRGDHLAKSFCTLNYAWRKFAHKKWQFHKVNLDAFEKGVARNIKQLSPGYMAPKVHMLAEGEEPPLTGVKQQGGKIEIIKR